MSVNIQSSGIALQQLAGRAHFYTGRKEMFYLMTCSTHFICGCIALVKNHSVKLKDKTQHGLIFGQQQGIFYMHHPTDRIAHTTAFVTPVVEHWLEQEIIQLSFMLMYCQSLSSAAISIRPTKSRVHAKFQGEGDVEGPKKLEAQGPTKSRGYTKFQGKGNVERPKEALSIGPTKSSVPCNLLVEGDVEGPQRSSKPRGPPKAGAHATFQGEGDVKGAARSLKPWGPPKAGAHTTFQGEGDVKGAARSLKPRG